MNIWDQLVDCICRPPRDSYSPSELLGGADATFFVGQMEATRIDYELQNKHGLTLKCSHYLPLDAKSADGKLPVVVYCHCNSGSRRDAEEAVFHLLPCGVGVVSFDFTGSGLSDGKWVTLGANEVDDLATVVAHLRQQGGVSSIGLWGRSMGAVTALLYSHRDHEIAGMVLDSPFSRLTDLMLEIVDSQRLPIPKVMLRLALRLMRASVRRKAGADINSVCPLDVVPQAAIPAMFGHGEQDSFINMQHSVKLYEAYNSAAPQAVYKNLVRFAGDHNHPRPAFFYSSVCCFFHQQLALDAVLQGGNPADAQQLLKYGSLSLGAAAEEQLARANGFITSPPWDLQPMATLTPEEQAAVAAAATAALSAEAERSGGARTGGGGSSDVASGGSASSGRNGSSHHHSRHAMDGGGGGSSSSSSNGSRQAAAAGRAAKHSSRAQQPPALHSSNSSTSISIQRKQAKASEEAGFCIGSRGAGLDGASLMAAFAASPSPPGSVGSGAAAAPPEGTGCCPGATRSVAIPSSSPAAAGRGGSGSSRSASAAASPSGAAAHAAGAGSPGLGGLQLRWPWKRGAANAGPADGPVSPAAAAAGAQDAGRASPQQQQQQQQRQQQQPQQQTGQAADVRRLLSGTTTTSSSSGGSAGSVGMAPGSASAAAAAGAHADAQRDPVRVSCVLSEAPCTADEEEAMLQQAIQLSLQASPSVAQPAAAPVVEPA